MKYIDDWDIEEIGQFVVDLPNTTGGLARKVKMEFVFGHTEITATATDLLSNSEATVTIDFMSSKEVKDNTFRSVK